MLAATCSLRPNQESNRIRLKWKWESSIYWAQWILSLWLEYLVSIPKLGGGEEDRTSPLSLSVSTGKGKARRTIKSPPWNEEIRYALILRREQESESKSTPDFLSLHPLDYMKLEMGFNGFPLNNNRDRFIGGSFPPRHSLCIWEPKWTVNGLRSLRRGEI
jgi:hypothetical protein